MKEKRFGPIRWVPGDNKGRYPYCHSLYVEGAGILLDPASDRDRLKELRDGPGVREVWLSHAHEDHLMHMDLFDHVPLAVSRPDSGSLENLDALMDAYGVEDRHRSFWRIFFEQQFNYRPRKPDRLLGSGEIISLGETTVEVISTPGHTPGHMAFFFREPGVLFMGDYDLSPFGPWYGDVLSSIEDTISSVRYLESLPAAVWLTGHETGVFEEHPGSWCDRYLGVIDRREEKLLAFLAEPRSLEEIAGAWIVYGKQREPEEFFAFGEKAHMSKHLTRLMKKGRVIFQDGRYQRV